MRRPLPALVAALAFWLGAALPALAHPHMSLVSRCEFVWKGQTLAGCYLDWAFDPYFSADIIQGYDRNGNGSFEPKETQALHDGAFQNLKNYKFFTFIRQGDRRSNPGAVSEFSAYQQNRILHYRFFVDLSAYKGDVWVAVYDYTYFCAIEYDPAGPVTLQHDPALVSASYGIEENRKYPVYYDPTSPATDTTLHYTWKKGLITFYPREIHVSYCSPP